MAAEHEQHRDRAKDVEAVEAHAHVGVMIHFEHVKRVALGLRVRSPDVSVPGS